MDNTPKINLFTAGFCAMGALDSAVRGEVVTTLLQGILVGLNLWCARR